MGSKILSGFRAFPLRFRVLVLAMFVDRLGGTMLFPFFALYVTGRFQVGMTQAGLLLGIFAVAGLAGSMAGGALSDKIGRRSIVIFGLVSSATSTLVMGLVDSMAAFYVLAVVGGLFGGVAGPAHSAMVADILPEEQRSEGFSLMRVAGNLAWILGPTIGGLLAARSYVLIFAADAVTSAITAYMVYRLIPETKPESREDGPSQSIVQVVAGYWSVASDRLYVAFLVASILMGLVYQQMYSTLGVYLHDVHGVTGRSYGLLLSADALMVVFFQFGVARRASRYPPMLMMALGTGLYMVGFTMYGFVATFALFLVAIIVITFGEMIVMPVSQALAARFAPLEMRGRYMAFFELSWSVPSMIGPAAAGLVMDNYNPNGVWYSCGLIALAAALAFVALHYVTQARFAAVEPATDGA